MTATSVPSEPMGNRQPSFASAADQRGFSWFARWVRLGGDIVPAPDGLSFSSPFLESTETVGVEVRAMLEEVQTSPLLAHAVARRFSDFCRWDQATDGGRTFPDGSPRP